MAKEMSADSSLSRIVEASVITGLSSLIASAIGLAKGKSIALLQGSEGIGLLGQFTSFYAFITGFVTLGLSLGIIKYTSQYLASKDYGKVGNYWSSAISVISITSATSCIALILLSGPISAIIFGNESESIYVIIIALSIPFSAFAALLNSLINGARAIKSLASITILAAMGSFIATIPLVYFLGKDGIITQIAVTSVVVLILNLYMKRKVTKAWPRIAADSRFYREEFAALFKFGVVSLITGMLLPLTMFIAQSIIIRSEGLSANGLFQGSWQLFWVYIGFATQTVSVYLLPTMSGTKEKAGLDSQVNNSLRFLVLAITPIACILVLFPGQILEILYNNEFTAAASLLSLMVVAGAFRIISYPVALALLAKNRLVAFLLIECSWYAVFIGVVLYLLPTIGILATGVGIIAAYVVHSALYVVLSKRILNIGYSAKNWALLLMSTAMLIAIAAMVYYFGIWASIAAAVLLPAWFMISTKPSDRKWILDRARALLIRLRLKKKR